MKAILEVNSPFDASKIAEVLIKNGYDVNIKGLETEITNTISYRKYEIEVSKDESNTCD